MGGKLGPGGLVGEPPPLLSPYGERLRRPFVGKVWGARGEEHGGKKLREGWASCNAGAPTSHGGSTGQQAMPSILREGFTLPWWVGGLGRM